MPRILGLLTVAALTVLLSACTQLGPYRTRTVDYVPGDIVPRRIAPNVVSCASGAKAGELPACEGPANDGVGLHALQHRHYVYREKDGGTSTADYHMAFVEFDDQGWFSDRKQMEALFLLLKTLEGTDDQQVLILLYVHGWKHNASRCDNNVVCFSRLVERMDIMERNLSARPRRVVGVYVGWRGLSLDAGALTNITFWTRKNTAERVGRGGMQELLLRLDDYRWSRNQCRHSTGTQLVLTGHSFGGLILYTALSNVVAERAVWMRTERQPDACGAATRSATERALLESQTRYDTARSFGDLIVLVNPAFEGSLYEPLFHVATNRCYDERQRPVMVVVTSKADDATGEAFPAGRAVNTLFEQARSPAQAESIKSAVGHDPRYQTHTLRTVAAAEDPATIRDGSACGCPHLVPTSDFKWWEYIDTLRQSVGVSAAGRVMHDVTDDGRVYRQVYGRDIELVGDPRYAPNYPYLVVQTDGRIIPDHNSIYTERFVEFMHLFFLQHVALQHTFPADCWNKLEACDPSGRVPCEQACRLTDGASCSGRTTTDLTPAR
jgi:hypothetical protein